MINGKYQFRPNSNPNFNSNFKPYIYTERILPLLSQLNLWGSRVPLVVTVPRNNTSNARNVTGKQTEIISDQSAENFLEFFLVSPENLRNGTCYLDVAQRSVAVQRRRGQNGRVAVKMHAGHHVLVVRQGRVRLFHETAARPPLPYAHRTVTVST